LKEAHCLADRLAVYHLHVHGKGPEPPEQPAEPGHSKELAPGHIVDGTAYWGSDERRVSVRDVIGSDDQRAEGDVVDALEPNPEVRPRHNPDERAE
jgi:hypothetical protein